MSKIFRLHSGASQNIEHWQKSPSHLSDNFINSIEDPAGANASTQITSIPSPFARMDLVRTSFRHINLNRELDGNSIYHRMISDCFDIAEIFFDIERLSDKVEILEWNSGIIVNGGELDIEPSSDLGKLINSTNKKHKLLGETLKMYLFQDQKAFNFSELKQCYLLNYKQGPEIINIIGGTSPSTLFFSSANDLSFVDITFGNDRVFDGQYCPLNRRNNEFIKFIYSFKNSFNNFSEKFADFNTYLEQTFLTLDDGLKEEIKKIDNNFYDEKYSLISVNNDEGNNVEILGFKLRARNTDTVIPSEGNDFIIEATKELKGLIPCVLPTEPFNESLRIGGGFWQRNWHENVPYLDERPINERTLPNQTGIKYPYLTISDLLEPYLIRLPFPTDNEKFFNGNYEVRQGVNDHGFVLPIKKKFFDFFSIQDLKGTVVDGKKMFELVQMPGGVMAILRIPIKNNKYIQFKRLYTINQFQDRIQKANEKENSGIVLENQFTLAIYPFIKLNPNVNPHYRILFVDRDVSPLTINYNYNLSYFKESNPSNSISCPKAKYRTEKKSSKSGSTSYQILEDNFDFIEVKNHDCSGIIIPIFPPLSAAANKFKFAIDFGTTNTHIEYKVNSQESKPFDIVENDIQVGTLHDTGDKTREYLIPKFGAIKLIDFIREEFLPFQINDKSQYKFPQRTIIYDNGRFNTDESTYGLADFNIPFWYQKESFNLQDENGTITSNLKWVDFKNDKRFEKRTAGFLKQILLMIRNKVLLNGGDLANTEIVWFYPSSMPLYRRMYLQGAWEKYYKRYFGDGTKLFKMSESFAPFYYYYNNQGIRPHDRPAVSIDIGGGTTDIVIYKSESPVLLTSFKFAANSIFGDGYGNTSESNGFVQRYETLIKDSLKNTEVNSLTQIYDDLKNKNSNSVELIEFFFSLESNQLVRDGRIPISFSEMLSKDLELKLVFLFFYSALIYHIAKIMKAKEMQIPEYITFSGNGAKVIKLTSGGSELSNLKLLTKAIFETVYLTEQSLPIEIPNKFFTIPKEITCKGGLECNESDYIRFENLEEKIKSVLIGTNDFNIIPTASLRYNQIENQDVIDSVFKEVNHFVDIFFDLNNKVNFYQNFGINPKKFDEYKGFLKEKIKNDLISGIKEKIKDSQDNIDINIEETLFFYPLIGAINRLAFKINNDNK